MALSSSIHSLPSQRSIEAPTPSSSTWRQGMLERVYDGLLTLILAFMAQLLIAGIQAGLDHENSDFPAPILAMGAVFVLFSILGFIAPGAEKFYQKRLTRAVELLNRHMSIGFTIPVVMLCRGPLADAHNVGMIIIAFMLTGTLNTVCAYAFARPMQCLLVRYDKHFWIRAADADEEKGIGQEARSFHKTAKMLCEGSPAGSLLSLSPESARGSSSDVDEPIPQSAILPGLTTTAPPTWRDRLDWAFRNPMLLLCWLVTLTIGLPLRYFSQNDVVFATSLLFAIWFTTLAVQSGIKSSAYLPPWLRTLLAGLSNAVLWTSLAMTAYVFADSALSGRPLPDMLDTLQTHTPLSTLILNALSSSTATTATPNPTTPGTTPNNMTVTIAAGDIAITVLNSGLVAWGFKLHLYRSRLLSRAGITILSVSSTLALANVTLGPLLARRALGVDPPARARAFAARSVTIALANPVMGVLGGDAGLDAAMVVGSGIVYQMGLGFGVGRWLGQWIGKRGWGTGERGGRGEAWRVRGVKKGCGEEGGGKGCAAGGGDAAAGTAARDRDGHTETQTQTQAQNETRARAQTQTQAPARDERDSEEAAAVRQQRANANDPRTVAAGVTVGVNAAAMGTAYLYEAQSEAAPYAALSMIALGVMTVVFSSIPPLARWVVENTAA